MGTPLALVTLGMLGGAGGAATYLLGGAEASIEFEAIAADFQLDALEADMALAAIDVDMTDEPVASEVEFDEIAIEA